MHAWFTFSVNSKFGGGVPGSCVHEIDPERVNRRSLDSVDARHGPGQGEIWNRRGLWPAEVGMVIGERVLVTSIEVVRANWHCMCRGSVLYLYHSN
jgi:hypothetical protein